MAHKGSFVPTGNAVDSVWQVCSGARLQAKRHDPFGAYCWGPSISDYLLIVNDQGETIGEADNYIYGASGYAVHLCDGSYSGFVPADQIDILEA